MEKFRSFEDIPAEEPAEEASATEAAEVAELPDAPDNPETVQSVPEIQDAAEDAPVIELLPSQLREFVDAVEKLGFVAARQEEHALVSLVDSSLLRASVLDLDELLTRELTPDHFAEALRRLAVALETNADAAVRGNPDLETSLEGMLAFGGALEGVAELTQRMSALLAEQPHADEIVTALGRVMSAIDERYDQCSRMRGRLRDLIES